MVTPRETHSVQILDVERILHGQAFFQSCQFFIDAAGTEVRMPYHFQTRRYRLKGVTLGLFLSPEPGNEPGFSVRELPGQ